MIKLLTINIQEFKTKSISVVEAIIILSLYYYLMTFINTLLEKESKRFDSVLWQKPLKQQKIKTKLCDNTKNTTNNWLQNYFEPTKGSQLE